MSSDYSSEEENNVSELSGEESDDSNLLESVTKEVEQLKPYLYEPLCSTHSKSCNNEGSNIEVDVVAEPSRVGVLNWCVCVRIVKKNQEMDAHSLRLVLDNCFLGKEFLLYANTVGINCICAL